MIEYEPKKPQFTGPRAVVYELAKKYRLGDDEAERIYLKIGASATEEEFVAEAGLRPLPARMPLDKAKKL